MAEIKEKFTEVGDAIEQRLATLATKKDLEAFATKKDLEAFATKKDLEAFATKKDLEDGLKNLRNELATVFHDTVANLAKVLDEKKTGIVPKQPAAE